jgi:hypothetical protein
MNFLKKVMSVPQARRAGPDSDIYKKVYGDKDETVKPKDTAVTSDDVEEKIKEVRRYITNLEDSANNLRKAKFSELETFCGEMGRVNARVHALYVTAPANKDVQTQVARFGALGAHVNLYLLKNLSAQRGQIKSADEACALLASELGKLKAEMADLKKELGITQP